MSKTIDSGTTPETSTGFSDEGLLCDACDTIDNTVNGAIEAVALGISKNGNIRTAMDCSETIDEAIKTLCPYPEDYDGLSKAERRDVRVQFVNTVENVIAETDPEIAFAMAEHTLEPGALEWDMAIIGEVTDALEDILKEHGVTRTCHPWQDDEEHICYSTCECCDYCPHKNQRRQ